VPWQQKIASSDPPQSATLAILPLCWTHSASSECQFVNLDCHCITTSLLRKNRSEGVLEEPADRASNRVLCPSLGHCPRFRIFFKWKLWVWNSHFLTGEEHGSLYSAALLGAKRKSIQQNCSSGRVFSWVCQTHIEASQFKKSKSELLKPCKHDCPADSDTTCYWPRCACQRMGQFTASAPTFGR